VKRLGTVFAVGARTPLGLDAKQTALLLRTGLPAVTAAPLAHPKGGPVTMAFDTTIDPMIVGEERAVRLAAAALRELALSLPSPRSIKARFVVAFTEPRPGQSRGAIGNVFSRGLATAVRETFGDVPVDVSTSGAAGPAYALPGALAALAARQVDAVIVGGVHSDFDPLQMIALDVAGRLFSTERLDAIVPGESAAFALIAREDFGATIKKPPLLTLHAIAAASGEITPYGDTSALDASALASVIRDTAGTLPEGLQVGWALADHGFEGFRVRELYSALTRTSSLFCPPIAIDAPAQRLGHTGAAAMPLGLVVASDMVARGYAPTPFGLVVGGSDSGERGAILVGAPS